jgi:hypothetical protein
VPSPTRLSYRENCLGFRTLFQHRTKTPQGGLEVDRYGFANP